MPKKEGGGGGLGLFADLRWGLATKREVMFLRGGLRPQCTLCTILSVSGRVRGNLKQSKAEVQ